MHSSASAFFLYHSQNVSYISICIGPLRYFMANGKAYMSPSSASFKIHCRKENQLASGSYLNFLNLIY